MAGKTCWWEREAVGHTPFYLVQDFSPWNSCHPHAGWLFPPQLPFWKYLYRHIQRYGDSKSIQLTIKINHYKYRVKYNTEPRPNKDFKNL